jgi:hypothetical protein
MRPASIVPPASLPGAKPGVVLLLHAAITPAPAANVAKPMKIRALSMDRFLP